MAVQKTSPRGGQAAAELLLQREEEKEQLKRERAGRRRLKRRRQRRREERRAVERMHQSVEVIKWCIVAICAVWVVSFVISIFVLNRVHSRVVEIEGQVDRIKDVMEHPFANVGARLGGDLDARLKEWLQLPPPTGEPDS